jgi:hypothetical protein
MDLYRMILPPISDNPTENEVELRYQVRVALYCVRTFAIVYGVVLGIVFAFGGELPFWTALLITSALAVAVAVPFGEAKLWKAATARDPYGPGVFEFWVGTCLIVGFGLMALGFLILGAADAGWWNP